MDNEFRIQEDNILRTFGGDEAFATSLGVYYSPVQFQGFEVSVLIENLWDTEFQEVSAVPASPRLLSFGLTKRF